MEHQAYGYYRLFLSLSSAVEFSELFTDVSHTYCIHFPAPPLVSTIYQ